MENDKPDMSDLEKYYWLAILARQKVVYDWDFWLGGYHFDYYSHQWDSYGAIKEGETSVCVGIAIFYSHLCHAADLPCWFVRTDPDYIDHTISYIPDINGNAYYADITENQFLASDASFGFTNYVDKAFSHIEKDCTEATFDYRDEDGDLLSTNIKDCFTKPYSDWAKEYASNPRNTDKKFETDYIEKGSGLPSNDPESYHASYKAYRSNFVEMGDVWFLDDFYEDPAEIKRKILENEIDEQLLDISGLEPNYTCDTIEELKTAVANDIKVKYFPTCENGEVVAKATVLDKTTDYKVTYVRHDDQTKDEVFSVEGSGAYKGAC